MVEDLGGRETDAQLPIASLIERLDGDSAGLVRAFVDERRVDPEPDGGDRMVGLATGGVPIYILRYGARARGITWFDRSANIVWLIAAHLSHRSGESSDSFPYFRTLAKDELRPTGSDYASFRAVEALETADAIFDAIPALRAQAAATPNQEVRGIVGPIPIRLLMVPGVPPPHVWLGVGMWRVSGGPQPSAEVILAIVSAAYLHEYADWFDLPYSRSSFPGSPWGQELVFEDFATDWPGR